MNTTAKNCELVQLSYIVNIANPFVGDTHLFWKLKVLTE